MTSTNFAMSNATARAIRALPAQERTTEQQHGLDRWDEIDEFLANDRDFEPDTDFEEFGE